MSDTAVANMSFEPGAVSEGVIPLCAPEMGGNELRYLQECVEGNWVSSVGPFVERLERAVAEYVGAKFAIATASGTAALHVALLLAGVGPGDEVIVPAITFIAPANAVRYTGAWPVFVDVEPEHWQLDPQKVEEFLRGQCAVIDGRLINKNTGRRVRAILPVHILGHPVDMDPIMAMARRFDLQVIEDCAESLGSKYKGRCVGTFGQMGCFSFNGNKVITTGGGGMLVTDDGRLAERARYLTTQAKDNPIEYVHKEIGYNYRLTNIQAAVGCAQLELLESYIERKRSIAARYDQSLKELPGIQTMSEAPWARSIKWLYTILVQRETFGAGSRDVLRRLARQRIQARPLWQPLDQSEAHRGAYAYKVEVAARLHREALSLPSSVGLTEEQQAKVVGAIVGLDAGRMPR